LETKEASTVASNTATTKEQNCESAENNLLSWDDFHEPAKTLEIRPAKDKL